MAPPPEVAEALIVDGLARRYGCLPTDILAGDVANWRIANIAALFEEKQPQQPTVKAGNLRGDPSAHEEAHHG